MPICDALSRLVPARQYVAMDWDSARRSDTASRWGAYGTALAAGFITIDEIRAREGLPPLASATTTPKEVEA